MNSNVYLQVNDGANYPSGVFSPSVLYPEYQYGESCISSENNDVYGMVRDCLAGYGLDAEHFGTPVWNPLGKYISPGNTVLVKPNWVMHFNGSGNYPDAMNCLVTHPSCLRAICDYCLIALKGTGKIIIGDAPMQDCDLPVLLEKAKFNEILSFYREHGENVEFMDFRKYQSIFNANKVITGKIFQDGEEVKVDLSGLSMHERRNGKRVYQVDNYDRGETADYQAEGKHIYSVNKQVLESDVIINFCKPKSHRLAGFTAAMKNMVGIIYHKASLPHRVEGSIDEGGDAYRYTSKLKKTIDYVLDRKILHEDAHNIFMATVDRYIYGALLLTARKVCRDPYIKGIWYGNDTIWRTACDLNYIEQYADREGRIRDSMQRRILNFADMIIAGERNGPCQPRPKKLGIIAVSEDAAAMDMVICRIMGFPPEKIPLINALLKGEADYLFGERNVMISSNLYDEPVELDGVEFPESWHFAPHDTWRSILDA